MRAPTVSTRTGRRITAISVAGLVAIGAALFGSPVAAQTIEVPIQDVATSGEPGSLVTMGSAEVAADLQGRSCEIAAVVTNQSSEHAGNTLVITSGDSKVEVANIEDVANAVSTSGGTLTLGTSIDVSVLLGDSGFTSLGSSLTVTCEPLPPTPPTPPVPATPTYTG